MSQSTKEPTSLLENAQQEATSEVPASDTSGAVPPTTMDTTKSVPAEQKSDVPDVPTAPKSAPTTAPAQGSSEKPQDVPAAP